MTYEQAFWRKRGFSGEAISDGSVMTMKNEEFERVYKVKSSQLKYEIPTIGPLTCIFDGTTNENEPALVCFIAARGVVEWSDQPEELRRAEVINCLVRYFGEEARDYVDYAEKMWQHEPYTGGCPTVCVTSSGSVMKDYARATREPFINLHLCGTESATQWQGYMDGAVESGQRAAYEVLYAMFGDSNEMKVDFKKTYYSQKVKIDEIVRKNNKLRRSGGLVSALTRLIPYVIVIAIIVYILKLFL